MLSPLQAANESRLLREGNPSNTEKDSTACAIVGICMIACAIAGVVFHCTHSDECKENPLQDYAVGTSIGFAATVVGGIACCAARALFCEKAKEPAHFDRV